jgi:hypothetical protein
MALALAARAPELLPTESSTPKNTGSRRFITPSFLTAEWQGKFLNIILSTFAAEIQERPSNYNLLDSVAANLIGYVPEISYINPGLKFSPP